MLYLFIFMLFYIHVHVILIHIHTFLYSYSCYTYPYSCIFIFIFMLYFFIFIFMLFIFIFMLGLFIFMYLYSHSCYIFIFKCPGSSKKIIHDKMSRIFNKNHSTFFWKRQLILVFGIQDLHSGDLPDCIINKVSAYVAKSCSDFGSCDDRWLSGTALDY